jgi:ABC-type multidrug transport system ATPase subunit
VLFSASIAENIAYARPDATYEQIVAAAEAASAHEFITRLPDGFDTQVGERGMRLSGGERQRLALARAFLKDAPILILDEPTSSVDPSTEAMIVEALELLMRDRTTILISHRESTLAPCDVRIELELGEIVASSLNSHLPDRTRAGYDRARTNTTTMSLVDDELAALRHGYARGMVTDEEARRRTEELECLLWRQVLDRAHRVPSIDGGSVPEAAVASTRAGGSGS